MKVFVAGASGVVGRRMVPMLVDQGHQVWGTTRKAEREDAIAAAGAHPVVVDAFDGPALAEAVKRAAPDVVVHQLTDLSGTGTEANARLRIEGTRNLVDAARAAGTGVMVAQSIAWLYAAGDGPAVETEPLDPGQRAYEGVAALEKAVAEMPRGVILRYGLLYGPGTWYAPDGRIAAGIRSGEYVPPASWGSFVHTDDAAAAAVAALDWPAGAVNIVDDHPTTDWPRAFGGTPQDGTPTGRPISNAKARALGWHPAHPRLPLP